MKFISGLLLTAKKEQLPLFNKAGECLEAMAERYQCENVELMVQSLSDSRELDSLVVVLK